MLPKTNFDCRLKSQRLEQDLGSLFFVVAEEEVVVVEEEDLFNGTVGGLVKDVPNALKASSFGFSFPKEG